MVGTIDFEDNAPTAGKLPLGIEVARPTVPIRSLDLSVWLLQAESAAEAYQVDLAQSLRPSSDVHDRFA